jgi:hypothetical protein
MNLQDLGNIGEFVGSIGVVLSLGYLALQIRSQNQEAQAAVTNSLSQQWLSFMAGVAADKELALIWVNGLDDFEALERHEKVRFAAVMSQFVQVSESLRGHYVAGKLEPEIWLGFDARVTDIMANPGAQEWWVHRKHWWSSEYGQYIEEKLAKGKSSHMYGGFKSDA